MKVAFTRLETRVYETQITAPKIALNKSFVVLGSNISSLGKIVPARKASKSKNVGVNINMPIYHLGNVLFLVKNKNMIYNHTKNIRVLTNVSNIKKAAKPSI